MVYFLSHSHTYPHVTCCRTVRILEGVADKTQDHGLYSSVIGQLKPVIDELGISTPEELGFTKA